MNIQYVPLEWVNRTWPDVEKHIASALEQAQGYYTVDQVKSLVTQGQWILLVAADENGIHGAATVNFYNRPNDRVAFITTTGGRFVINRDTFQQLKNYAISMGATTIESCARESVARLLRGCGFEEKHRIVGVKI
jgi:hypothetical protein